MKNNLKYVLIFVIGALGLSSCEDLETNFDALTKDYDKNNSTFYIQFLNASAYYETAIDEAGLPTNIVTTVGVALQGAPQSSDITVDLSVSSSSTLTSDMYTLSASSITIPAGSTSGSVTLTALADKMPEDEVLNLIVNMESVPAAPSAYQLNYELKRIKFCPLEDLNDLVGSWGGFDSYGYDSQVVTFLEGDVFMLDGLCVGWMTGYWGEVVIEQIPIVVTMNPDGTLEFEEQYYMSTTWNGDPQPTYSVSGTGKWDNCKKTLLIDYDLHQGGSVLESFTEEITLK